MFPCFFSLIVCPLLPNHCSCIGLLLHLITFNVTRTLGRTALDEGSARLRDLYVTKHNIHTRLGSMRPVKFEPGITASELQLHRATTEIGCSFVFYTRIIRYFYVFLTVHHSVDFSKYQLSAQFF